MKLNIQGLNLNNLLHFHSVAKHKSLRKAAQELHLSAPAVTHSLNHLEHSISETLCVRNRSEFSLTEAGAQLYKTTQKIFFELENFSIKSSDKENFNGVLNIGILDHFENQMFASAIHKTVKKFPQMKLNVQSYDSDKINQLLIEKEIDIGSGIFNQQSPRLKYSKIGEEKLCYYISKNHPLWSKNKITQLDLVGQKVTWLDNQNRKKSDLELNIFVENLKYKMQFYGFANNLSAALQILISGHSIVPLPEFYGNSLTKQYAVKKIPLDTKGRTLEQSLAYNPSFSSTYARKFILANMDSSN